MQVAEQEIDIQAALVRLVHDDRVITFQLWIIMDFSQQNAIGHEFDPRGITELLLEPHLVTDSSSQLLSHLLGKPAGPRCGPQYGVAG